MTNLPVHTPLDKVQFERLFKEHFVHLCNFANQYVHDLDTAKDIVQKVFVSLWENRAGIDSRKSVASYLFTSVKNRSLNYIRDQKKYRSHTLDLDCGDFEIAISDDEQDIQELKDRIKKALSTLPEKCRLVFEMSRYQQMKYREIAEELSISQKTVEAHMTKAMKSLRANLREYSPLLLFLLNWII